MSNYAFEFYAIHLIEQSGSNCDCGVLRVAPRSECVRCVIMNDVHLWLRQATRDAQTFNQVVQASILIDIGRDCTAYGQRNFV